MDAQMTALTGSWCGRSYSFIRICYFMALTHNFFHKYLVKSADACVLISNSGRKKDMTYKKKKWQSIVFEIGKIVALAALTLVAFCDDCLEDPIVFLKSFAFSSAIWLTLWKGNAYLGTLLDFKLSWVRSPVKRLIWGLIVTITYTTSIVYLLILVYQWTFDYRFSDERILSNIQLSLLITLLVSIFMHARSFLKNWKKSELDAEKLKNESLASRYESLKNQINPHFLFNSFNALTDLIYHDQEMAAKFVKQLSLVYRYVLEKQAQELVPLEEELGFVRSYLFLEKIRYGENLQVNYNLNQHVATEVPPLSIQMLIENAIKHNIISREEPLKIDIKSENNEYIVVSNNLQKKPVPGNNSTGVGLKNIKARYEFFSSKLVQILEENNRFTVKLPFVRVQTE